MDGPRRGRFSTAPEKIMPAPLAQKYLANLPHGRTEGHPLYLGADGHVIGDWFGLGLASVFQPIVEAGSRAVVGNEAFLRSASVSADDQGLYPWTLFSSAATDERVIALDRLARTVHLLNSIIEGNRHPLFLNVHGRLLAAVADDHGRAFRRVVNTTRTPTRS
jgi:EAL domain-containing protein (putative c-di-GMP-specific phosphodiesterase class I)